MLSFKVAIKVKDFWYNKQQHLNAWIPIFSYRSPNMKPVKNTVVPRMPVYENIYTKEQIAIL